MITRNELVNKYIEFFKSKDHAEIPSASLIPENDPTVLFTTAGMQPLVPFFLGQPHPEGNRLTNVQKCIRTVDIDEVGDTYHHTLFEMLGNWSIGDYWKKEAISLTFEFFHKILEIPLERLAITCFAGDERSEKDEESAEIWKSLGIPKERIAFLKDDNWWGPAGKTGPCGPSTEIFYWKDNSKPVPETFDPEDETWVELGNDVLMQYTKDEEGNYEESERKIIDFGGGTERIVAALNGIEDNYLSEVWQPIIKKIEELSAKKYEDEKRAMRIIADHIKAATFILSDNVTPGNAEQGYVLRRLIRRAVRYGRDLNISEKFTSSMAQPVIEIYKESYPNLESNKDSIIKELDKEEDKFLNTIEEGEKQLAKIIEEKPANIDGKTAFLLYQSYGFPLELTKELANQKNIDVDEAGFKEELRKHKELSRTAAEGKFKIGLADNSEQTKKLHTATHLLNEALRRVLNDDEIKQRGSNITPERLRFDFSFDKKLTDEEKQEIEELVNKKISEGLEVQRKEMSLESALESGAQAEFGAKYPDKVSVYTIIDPEEEKGWFSKEICTGPHVNNTNEIGTFKIKKEQSSSAGVRRIKAVVE